MPCSMLYVLACTRSNGPAHSGPQLLPTQLQFRWLWQLGSTTHHTLRRRRTALVTSCAIIQAKSGDIGSF
jgi:hypothetical protein